MRFLLASVVLDVFPHFPHLKDNDQTCKLVLFLFFHILLQVKTPLFISEMSLGAPPYFHKINKTNKGKSGGDDKGFCFSKCFKKNQFLSQQA